LKRNYNMCFKRGDGTLVRDSKDPIGAIMPYIMRAAAMSLQSI